MYIYIFILNCHYAVYMYMNSRAWFCFNKNMAHYSKFEKIQIRVFINKLLLSKYI